MTTKMSALAAYRMGKLVLPYGYAIEHGADVPLLRRGDGSVVAAFGANTPPSQVVRVAERDFRADGRSTPDPAAPSAPVK
jgi:hypothetical protein